MSFNKKILNYIPGCLAVTDSSMFFQGEKDFIFTSILSSGLITPEFIFQYYKRSEYLRIEYWVFFKLVYLQKRPASLRSVLFHWGILLHV